MIRLFFALVLFPALALGQATSETEQAFAEAGLGLLHGQEIAAGRCDRIFLAAGRKEEARLMAQHEKFRLKFRDYFARFEEAHKRKFQRLHGRRWKELLNAEDDVRTRILSRTIRMALATCGEFSVELALRVDRPWGYIQAILNDVVQRGRARQ